VTTFGVHVSLLLAVGVAVLAVVVFLLIVFAPWKSVRDEPPLDDDIETRLLLGEDPTAVAIDADAAEDQRAPVHDLDAGRRDDDA
jgi:hypothetical protein